MTVQRDWLARQFSIFALRCVHVRPSAVRRELFALDLIDDDAVIAAYEKRHAPGAVWPAVIDDIRERGISGMEIWLVRDRLVMITDVADDYPRLRNANLAPAVDAWETMMSVYQRPLVSDGPKWSAMRRIFCLSEQCGG